MNSSRLPGKVLADAAGAPMLSRMIDRISRVSCIDEIVIATTTNTTDDQLQELANRCGVRCFRGSEHDVMGRVLGAARSVGADTIVELTGDCPVIDPAIIEEVITKYRTTGVDYCANVLERTYPLGMDTQVFATEVLQDAYSRTDDPTDREHVSLFIYRNPALYSLRNIPAPTAYHNPEIRLTLDTQEDLVLLQWIFTELLPKHPEFTLADILDLLRSNPEMAKVNASVQHNWV